MFRIFPLIQSFVDQTFLPGCLSPSSSRGEAPPSYPLKQKRECCTIQNKPFIERAGAEPWPISYPAAATTPNGFDPAVPGKKSRSKTIITCDQQQQQQHLLLHLPHIFTALTDVDGIRAVSQFRRILSEASRN